MQFLGDLASRLAAADYQDLALRQRFGAGEATDIHRHDVVRQRLDAPGGERLLICAGRDNEVSGAPGLFSGIDLEARVIILADRSHLDAGPNGAAEAGGIAFEVSDDLVARHETVRVVPVIRVSRQPHRPVRRHQTETVPSTGP